ncbi:MAG: ribbon-helix-helix domain-containing protein [Aulosira sp. DedQUE10]|nr:ribbon-helix-helix domain-containing protein [Aulosira sp. DedQUE10]
MNKKHKRQKGVPEIYDELKQQVNMSLTPSAVEKLDAIATEKGISSRSELIEQIARGIIPISDNTNSTNYQNCVLHSYPDEAIQDQAWIEFTPGQNIIRLSEWKKLPSNPGVFALYIDMKDSNVYLNVSINMKQAFMDYMKIKHNIEDLISSDGDAYLIWSQCNDRQFINKIKEDFRNLCIQIRNDNLFKCQTLPTKKSNVIYLNSKYLFSQIEFEPPVKEEKIE